MLRKAMLAQGARQGRICTIQRRGHVGLDPGKGGALIVNGCCSAWKRLHGDIIGVANVAAELNTSI